MRNLAERGSRFRAAAPNHPETLLEEPEAFQAVGENSLNERSHFLFKKSFCFEWPLACQEDLDDSCCICTLCYFCCFSEGQIPAIAAAS